MGQVASLCEALGENNMSALDLSQVPELSEDELTDILDALSRNQSVKSLTISNQLSMQASTPALCRTLRSHPYLCKLVITNSVVSPEVIIAAGACKKLQILHLENCRLDSIALRALGNLLQNSMNSASKHGESLKLINLKRNTGFSDMAMKNFVQTLSDAPARSRELDIVMDRYSVLAEYVRKEKDVPKGLEITGLSDGCICIRKLMEKNNEDHDVEETKTDDQTACAAAAAAAAAAVLSEDHAAAVTATAAEEADDELWLYCGEEEGGKIEEVEENWNMVTWNNKSSSNNSLAGFVLVEGE
eukprot:TRINITY_DN61_c0_g1_i1.p1 TRINITY_DN61_c0_g1~~TRINITY_DN61_c0_g1_i1.p1  ORF type:complete len:302 (+),score=94.11 TRINITY_DN61_c0_g1_i1:107-1012(+)